MKVIDLLNKIANGEESDIITEFEFDKRIWNFFKLQDSEYCVDKWLLNQEIVITKHKEVIEEEPRDIEVCGSLFTRSEYNRLARIKEDKKIEKLDHKDFTNRFGAEEITDVKLVNKINEIIDKVNKGE